MNTAVFARNLLLESPICTNTHNYAIQFQRAGWNTIWIPKPATPWNLVRQSTIETERYGIRQLRLSFLFNYGGRRLNSHKICWDLFPYFRLSPGRHIMRSVGSLNPELFFAGSLETASLYKLFKPRVFIYNAHDAFSLYPQAHRSIALIEAEVLKHADVTVTTAETTRELLIGHYGIAPERIINLGHGVDNSRYKQVAEPAGLREIPRPRAVCLGTLDMQDIDLTLLAVRALPDVSFLFIGPGGERLRTRLQLAGSTNAHFLGPIHQDRLPDYLSFCDVGLIGYDMRLKQSRLYGSNPMKRYDYAAAGLQVVSVDLLEYGKTPSPLYVARSAEEFVDGIRSALSTPRYSRDEIVEFAKAHDWSVKYDRLMSRLGEILKRKTEA